MKQDTQAAKAIYLKDYTPHPYKTDEITLKFDLHPTKTKVVSVQKISPNPQASLPGGNLELNGENQEEVSFYVNGVKWSDSDISIKDEITTLLNTPLEEFELRVESYNNPEKNTSLNGLYRSGSIFCTQNEPEGLRRITYFIDRPDNLSVFTTEITAPKAEYPVLLSNGNLIKTEELENGLHKTIWNDPFPKPCYLFALVAGDLGHISDEFQTASGRKVDLKIFCDPGNENRCHYAMESLKKSMKWDEEKYGLEYDLDIFMIVAVDSFNMGAMENKGLNIFNSSYVLADQETATDDDFDGIEGVIGHEYFHNWSGNRITCRDWFQLTLKEGLTVLRDQDFSADMNSRAVYRIKDVQRLREVQFSEDAGPMSHPIRPESYIEINNFYTSTIYEKGAEVIRMMKTLLGEENYRKGTDLYFSRYDGQAVTTEEFVLSLEEASGVDLKDFRKWYSVSGTPELKISSSYDAVKGELALDFRQSCKGKDSDLHIPLRLGALSQDGKAMALELNGEVLGERPLEIRKTEERFVLSGLTERPVLSLNHDFSAPVKISYDHSIEDLGVLCAYGPNEFSRFEAFQTLWSQVVSETIKTGIAENSLFENAYGRLLEDDLDPAFKALALGPKSLGQLLNEQKIFDIDATAKARSMWRKRLGDLYKEKLITLYKNHHKLQESNLQTPLARGNRRLKEVCLGLLGHLDEGRALGSELFRDAQCMTDYSAALTCAIHNNWDNADEMAKEYEKKWSREPLAIQRFIRIAVSAPHSKALEWLDIIQQRPYFDKKVPNYVRSLWRVLGRNYQQFFGGEGEGVAKLLDFLPELDQINPQMAAGMANLFRDKNRLPAPRREQIQKGLERVLAQGGGSISKDLYEVVAKISASH